MRTAYKKIDLTFISSLNRIIIKIQIYGHFYLKKNKQEVWDFFLKDWFLTKKNYFWNRAILARGIFEQWTKFHFKLTLKRTLMHEPLVCKWTERISLSLCTWSQMVESLLTIFLSSYITFIDKKKCRENACQLNGYNIPKFQDYGFS